MFIDFRSKREPKSRQRYPLYRHSFDPVPQVVFLQIPWLVLMPFWLDHGRFRDAVGSILVAFGFLRDSSFVGGPCAGRVTIAQMGSKK